jgi:hypothetical protein
MENRHQQLAHLGWLAVSNPKNYTAEVWFFPSCPHEITKQLHHRRCQMPLPNLQATAASPANE